MFEKPKKTKVKWHGQQVTLPFNCGGSLTLAACRLELVAWAFRKARHFFTYEGGRSSSAIVKYLNSDRLELSLINQEPPYIVLESAV